MGTSLDRSEPGVACSNTYRRLAGNLLGNRELILLFRDDAGVRAFIVWFDVGILGLTLAATVFVIRVIRAIDARQEAKRARIAGGAAPVAPVEP